MAKGKLEMKKTRDQEYLERKSREADGASTAPQARDQEYKKVMFYLPMTDVSWINAEIERYRRATKIRLKKSQIVHLALELVRTRGGINQAIVDTSKDNSRES